MYVRPPSYRYPPSVRVPDNYSGNAFREQETPPLLTQIEEPESEETQIQEEPGAAQEISEPTQASLTSAHRFGLRLGSIFGKKSGIGTEELLIIALILLLSDNDGEGFDDLILFLALLFFIK